MTEVKTQFGTEIAKSTAEGDQFKVNMGEKQSITNIDIKMYLTLLGNI